MEQATQATKTMTEEARTNTAPVRSDTIPTRTELVRVDRTEGFEDLIPKFLIANGKEVAVYRWKGQFFAYLNECPHQLGPACEGVVWPDIECDLASDKRIQAQYLSEDKFNIICPWHALEFDLRTGIARGTIDGIAKLKLRKIEVLIENGEVKIKI